MNQFLSYKVMGKEELEDFCKNLFPIRDNFIKLWDAQKEAIIVDTVLKTGFERQQVELMLDIVFNENSKATSFDLCQILFWCNEIMTDVVLMKTAKAMEENKALRTIIESQHA